MVKSTRGTSQHSAAAEKLSKISDSQNYLSNKLQLLHIAAACMGQWILRSPSSCPSAPVIHCHCPSEGIDPLGSVCAVILMWLNMKIAVYEMFFELQLDFDESLIGVFLFENSEVTWTKLTVFIQAILSTTLADLESMRTWKSNNRPMRCHFRRLDCNC